MPQITQGNVAEIFTYHAPTTEQVATYGAVRRAALDFAHVILTSCPESAERTLALRDVQRAVMMANASIALAHVK